MSKLLSQGARRPTASYRCKKCDAWLLDAEGAPASLCPRCDRVECVNIVKQLYRRLL